MSPQRIIRITVCCLLLASLAFSTPRVRSDDPPTVGNLAHLDPALLITPPPGFEIGYGPIATRQELRDLNPK